MFVILRGDRINCAGVFYAERTCHGATVAEMNGNFKEKDLPLMTWFFGPDSPEFRGFKDLSLHGIVGIAP